MLEDHFGRMCTAFAADYEPKIGFANKLSDAAEAIHRKLAAEHWGAGVGNYLIRDPKTRFILNLDFRRLSCQTLGLASWQKRLGDLGPVIKTALEKMDVEIIKHASFKLSSFLHLGMSHSEMAGLMFGAFLLPAPELEIVCEKLEDTLIQLHGTHKNMKNLLILAPMTIEHSIQQFLMIPNLEHFLEPKLLDTGIKEFRDRLSAPCFFVDVDLACTDCVVADVPRFLKDSLDGALHICEQAVLRLKSLKPKQR